jgi:hypothetical protein
MASILQQIGTPLQLAALLLLLVAGVARLLVRSGAWKASPPIGRLVINRLFQVAMAALVVGVIAPAVAPTLDHWLNSDETFHGAVLSTAGETIPGASVNLITIGAVSTNALGQYEITVPRSRTLKEYKLQVKATGFETPPVLTKSAADMQNLEIRLTPAPPELVKALEPGLMAGQYFGVPFVLVTLRVENDGASLTTINEVQATLASKDASFTLSPSAWTIVNPFGPFAPVTGPFPIPAGLKLDLRIVLTAAANFASLYRETAALPAYSTQLPCVQKFNGMPADPMSDDAFRITKRFADEHFGWREGEWHLEVHMAADNQARSFQRDFAMTASDIERLRTSFTLLRQCMATNILSPVAQDGNVANFVTK